MSALERRRRDIPGERTPLENRALEAVRCRFPAGLSEETGERVLDAAVVLTVSASSPRDEGFRSVANLLDGVLVPAGRGSAAITALQRAFQAQAAAATGGNLDEWLRILEAAGLETFPDAEGTAGQRRRHELNALASYRSRLAAEDGVLQFTLLADYLPPMKYGPLADSFRVTVPGRERDAEKFLIIARRWPRVLLKGLPGMGKSTALQQAAARWAADARAPLPVLIPLRRIAKREPRNAIEVTLPLLIEAATEGASEDDRKSLRLAIERALSAGEAVLLLDGLDECGIFRGMIADGLASIIKNLPSSTGVVLATRDSALAAARKLGMSEARLVEPAWLEGALNRLLGHAAAVAGTPEGDARRRWTEARMSCVPDSGVTRSP